MFHRVTFFIRNAEVEGSTPIRSTESQGLGGLEFSDRAMRQVGDRWTAFRAGSKTTGDSVEPVMWGARVESHRIMDPFASFKAAQKVGWAHFAPLEVFTTLVAAQLVKFARVHEGQQVLDVGCGTGVVAVTAARSGAKATGLDLSPDLLERARSNSQVASVSVDWHEGDVENLPFADATFDVVLSQFGHIFAPRPEVAVAEMLRVLKCGGTLAFATWPPELFTGRMFQITSRYMPASQPDVPPPPLWGDPRVVLDRLGTSVHDVKFDRRTMAVPALSPQHFRRSIERSAGPIMKVVETLSATDPARLAAFRGEYDALINEYYEDNIVRQDYLLTRAVKA